MNENMNILFLNKFNDYWEQKLVELKTEFPDAEFSSSYDPDQRPELLKKADAVICGRLSKEEIENSPNLKLIIVHYTGLNNFPLDLIKQKGIMLANTHAQAHVVAEHAVALAFALLGRIIDFHDDLKRGFWNRSLEKDDMWTSLYNKRIGIIGFGHIGKNIASLLKPFNCYITGFKKNINMNDFEPANEISNDLSYVIEKSDVIFIALPSGDSTKLIVSKELLMKMNGKYLINVGRGDTIDEEGLYESLKHGILAGAALDVWFNYPGKKEGPVMPANKPFWELPNVVFSPHKSSHVESAIKAMIDDTFENIRSYLNSGKPKNIVNY
jgi:lactate dehydrogenase-like 2-hydroxyacid dehydrogenase